MAEIKDSGTRRTFGSGAVRDMQEGKGRCDLLPACAVLRLARHFEAGCNKYGDRNWEKGIPIHSFVDSAIRHLMKYLDGQEDEDHLIAAAWNCMCAAWTEEKLPHLQDIPTRLKTACAEHDCYYNVDMICTSDSIEANPHKGKDCKHYSED